MCQVTRGSYADSDSDDLGMEPEILHLNRFLGESQLLILRSKDLGAKVLALSWAVPWLAQPQCSGHESWSRGSRAWFLRMQILTHVAWV